MAVLTWRSSEKAEVSLVKKRESINRELENIMTFFFHAKIAHIA